MRDCVKCIVENIDELVNGTQDALIIEILEHISILDKCFDLTKTKCNFSNNSYEVVFNIDWTTLSSSNEILNCTDLTFALALKKVIFHAVHCYRPDDASSLVSKFQNTSQNSITIPGNNIFESFTAELRKVCEEEKLSKIKDLIYKNLGKILTKQNHKSEDITIFLNSLEQFSKKNAQIKLEYNKIDTRDHMLCSLLKIVFASGSEKVVCSALTDDDKPKLIQEDMVNSRFIVVNEEAFIERKGELLEIWNKNKIQPKEVRSKVVASSINPIEQNRLS